MTLYAQHGYGKGDKLNELAEAGAIAGVILSPADEGRTALRATVRAMTRRNVETLLDPQTYVYTIDRAVARCHEEVGLDFGQLFWASVTPSDVQAQVEAVIAANVDIGTTGAVVAPSPLQGTFNDLWLPLSMQYARTTLASVGRRAVLASVIVEEAGLGDWAAIERWLDVVTTLDVEGFYLVVCRRSAYPAAWERTALANLMRIIYRLAILNDFRVVAGYADIGGLAAAAMGAQAVASGWNYRQRQFDPQRWIPRKGGQQAIPRVTSAALLSALLGYGEMDGAARSALGVQVLPNANLRARITTRPDSWSNPEAVVQHLDVLSGLIATVDAAGPVPDRLDVLAAMAGNARRLLLGLARAGVTVGAGHTTAVLNLAAAAADARRSEGI